MLNTLLSQTGLPAGVNIGDVISRVIAQGRTAGQGLGTGVGRAILPAPAQPTQGVPPAPAVGQWAIPARMGGLNADPRAFEPKLPPLPSLQLGGTAQVPQPGESSSVSAASEEGLKLQALLDAIRASGQIPTYEPPPSMMLPKIPGWLAAVMAGLSILDPSQQVGPAIAQGLVQNSQMRSQQEAERRKAAIEATLADRDARLRMADLEYRVAANKGAEAREQATRTAADERNFQQQKEIVGMQQAGLTERARLSSDSKALAQAVKAAMSKYAVGRKAALGILHSEGKISDETYNANIGTASEETTSEIKDRAQAADAESRTKERDALLSFRKQKFRDEHGLSEARAANLAKKTALMDDESAAKIAVAYKRIEDIDSKISDRAEGRKLGYAKLSGQLLVRSQDGLRTALTTITDQTNKLRTRVQEQQKALAVAEDDDEKARINEDIKGLESAIKTHKDLYGETLKKLEDVRGGMATAGMSAQSTASAQSSPQPQKQGSASDAEYRAAVNQVQKLLNEGKIDQATANKRWAAIKRAAGR